MLSSLFISLHYLLKLLMFAFWKRNDLNSKIDIYIYITLTLYIYINCNCYWCPYRVAGCTTVWSWFISLYVCDFKDRPVVKHNAGTVCFEPLPHNTCVRICIGQYTSQCSCLSLCNFVWTKGTWCHFWFIYQTVVNNIAYSAGKSFLGYFGYLFIKI